MANKIKPEDLIAEALVPLTPSTKNKITPTKAIPTQYKTLNDEIFGIGGLPRGHVVELAAETHMGKTSLAQNLVAHCQEQGLNCLWVAAEIVDPSYMEKSGIEISDECENPIQFMPFTTGEDFAEKLKLFIAFDLFDIIVVDSIQRVNPTRLVEAEGDYSMFVNQASAMFWTNLLRDLSGGYQIKCGEDYVPSATEITILKKGKFVSENKIHRLKDKQCCLILINHLKQGVGMFAEKNTPGGKGKDFEFTYRLWLGPTKGGVKRKSKTDRTVVWKDVSVYTKKAKMGTGEGHSVIMRLQNGVFTELGQIQQTDIDDQTTDDDYDNDSSTSF